MKRNKNIRNGIIVAVLLLAVGFATVATQLIIEGSVGVSKMNADYDRDLVFTSGTLVNKAGDTVGTATVENAGKVLSFEFTEPISSMDDVFTLNYTVKNNSDFDSTFDSESFNNITIYNGETEETNAYINVNSKVIINETLAPEATASGAYEITPSRAYAGDNEITYTIDITLDATGEEVTTPAA